MTINYRQVTILTFLSLIAMKLLALPSLLYTKSENMSWLVCFVLMAIDAIYAFLILSLIKKSGSRNINEFMNDTIGPVLTKVFLVCLLIKFGSVFASAAKGLEIFVVENFYNQFDWPIFVLPLVILTGYMAYRGIRNIARVSEIFCWAIIISCLYIAFKSLKGVEVLTFLPMFEKGFTPLLESGYTHLGWFGSSTFLIMLFGKVDFKQEKKAKLISYIVFALLLIQVMYFVFYGSFGVTSPIHNFCISDLCQFSTGQTTTDEITWLVVALWIIAEAIQIALYGYCIMLCFMYLFNTENPIIPIILNDILLIALGYIGSKTINLEQIFLEQHIRIITIITQYFIPIVLWLGYLMKSKKEKQLKVVENERKIKNNI